MISIPKRNNKASSDNGSKQNKLNPEYRFLITVTVALAIASVLSLFVFRLLRIEGNSMDGSLSHNDWLIAAPLAYCKDAPERGDIIIFRRESLTGGVIVKRVVGLPGETVEIKNGSVFIDGAALKDPYFVFDDNDNLSPITVEADSYFVLGDNRDSSNDSRHWDEPFVKKSEIRGKVILKIIPEISLPTHSIF